MLQCDVSLDRSIIIIRSWNKARPMRLAWRFTWRQTFGRTMLKCWTWDKCTSLFPQVLTEHLSKDINLFARVYVHRVHKTKHTTDGLHVFEIDCNSTNSTVVAQLECIHVNPTACTILLQANSMSNAQSAVATSVHDPSRRPSTWRLGRCTCTTWVRLLDVIIMLFAIAIVNGLWLK